MQRNRFVTCKVLFVAHYPDKCFYNELVTATFYMKKRESKEAAPWKCSLKVTLPKFLKHKKR